MPKGIHVMPEGHAVTIERLQGVLPAYRGRCQCGWRGEWRQSSKQASGDLGTHMADTTQRRSDSK